VFVALLYCIVVLLYLDYGFVVLEQRYNTKIQQKHNSDTIEQRCNSKVQQKRNPATTEQRYNTKIQQKHNPDTIEQRYNSKLQQKDYVFVVLLCCIVVLLYLDCVFLVFFVLYQCSFVAG
jgi:hypothetical protein